MGAMELQEVDLHEKARIVYQGLLQMHGEIERTPRREPMHELISTMLSHKTTGKNEDLAYARMWQKFGSWEKIRDAPEAELAEAIAASNYPEVKAPNIQKTLAAIIAERGEARIDFLADLPTDEALKWLVKLPGVGVKTATLTLLFCFGKEVLPVDTHLHRVSGRLGLIGPKTSADKAHKELLALLPREAHVLFNFHIGMLKHGQKICVWNTPRCQNCVLTNVCDYFQANQKLTDAPLP
ncbi:endonuclease-3 [Abditibacterium utsteinense]|uniref:Endonuclease-3 n=2 Tax=Abditibacterium utsteinense TaxID=1960156 RepID=A0A2S8SV87_9BACT|nr:endonuclease-3 [Abditibacterium utsteinense]